MKAQKVLVDIQSLYYNINDAWRIPASMMVIPQYSNLYAMNDRLFFQEL